VAALRDMTSLTRLNLADTQVTDNGVEVSLATRVSDGIRCFGPPQSMQRDRSNPSPPGYYLD
jgi:hypothetical protein